MATDLSAPPPTMDQVESQPQDQQPITNGYVETSHFSLAHINSRFGLNHRSFLISSAHRFPLHSSPRHPFNTDYSHSEHELSEQTMHDADAANSGSFRENSVLSTKETTINVKDAVSAEPGLNPAGPTPTEDVVGSIQPVADFLPKAAPPSHPTPPPDQPLDTGEANGDIEMANTESQPAADSQPAAQPQPAPQSELTQPSEPSLVRPREDDEDDEERAAKRSRMDVEPEAEAEQVVVEEAAVKPNSASAQQAPAPVDVSAATATSESAAATPVEALKSEETSAVPNVGNVTAAAPAPTVEQPVDEVKPSVEHASAPASAPAAAPPVESSKYSTAPMTPAQKVSLLEKMKNLKKTKSSVAFLRPVDPVALNIPHYPDFVKNPMDLGTMERKLKDDQYPTVQDFANDFQLVVSNCRAFNGDQHPVTTNAMSMEAYFQRMMEKIPSADQPLPQKALKRSSPAVKAPPRRESRAVATPAAPAESRTYALQADGMPEIRRESNSAMGGRPARAIKPPANREIPYAKPKRKEHQLELRFCEHVLDEISSNRYAAFNSVFQQPVDPVALNIPNYRQIIKQPMDLATMRQKLKQGQYGSAKECRKDFELMIENCLTFNPTGNMVRDMGISMRRQFETLWNGKEKWERAHKPESQRATSASDEESGEEEEEDDEPEDGKEQTIQALQKQLADMQSMIGSLTSGGTVSKSTKSKKSKVKSTASKQKYGSVSAAPKAKVPAPKTKAAAPKKPRQVTYDEKQEISEAVNRMNEAQVSELTRIITENCAKYRDMDEMELEIDELPNDVQALLLKYVRKLFGKPKSAAAADSPPDDGAFEDDGEFAPARAATAGKRKKHKPMGKREQAETINALKAKLGQFGAAGTSGSESPNESSYNHTKAESSGDDESEESEEE